MTSLSNLVDIDYFTPYVAGLAELLPWLHHGHDDAQSDRALHRPDTQLQALLATQRHGPSLTSAALGAWVPHPPTCRRRVSAQ